MLEFKNITLKSATLGEDSVLPNIVATDAIPFFRCDDTVDGEQAKKVGTGVIASILPYKMQASYTREESEKEYTAAILEDENYKAVFLPQLGGRLWSLYDKKNGKDLVYCNDSVKFANLALCNAWFAGGVEWNLGIKGHSPYTCRPLFAKKVKGKSGNDILRMYEYEEIRGLVYAVEATLTPDGLAVHIVVDNTKDEPTLMYWWSNIAAPQTDGTRVYVPTGKTYVTSYREGGYHLSKKDVPFCDGKDISDPYHAACATDYFYDILDENPKWISSIEGDGFGLLHYSDSQLIGRKTFLWGKSTGGQHWNEWLTTDRDYLEIQAGLCKTQFEHFEIPAYHHIEWCELYTGVQLEKKEYKERVDEINSKLPDITGLNKLFEEDFAEEPVILGSGRGYLAQRLLNADFGRRYDFVKESLKGEDEYYLALLENRYSEGDENTAFVHNKEWEELILAKPALNEFDLYILGVLGYENGEMEKAKEYFEKALAIDRKWYILASLAMLESSVFANHKRGVALALEAVKMNKNRELMALYGEIAIRAGEYEAFVIEFENSSTELRNIGRLRMYCGQSLVLLGRTEDAKKYINDKLVVPDIREGEYAISNIWIMLYRKEMSIKYGRTEENITEQEVLSEYPISKVIDFRMH